MIRAVIGDAVCLRRRGAQRHLNRDNIFIVFEIKRAAGNDFISIVILFDESLTIRITIELSDTDRFNGFVDIVVGHHTVLGFGSRRGGGGEGGVRTGVGIKFIPIAGSAEHEGIVGIRCQSRKDVGTLPQITDLLF